MLTELLDQKHNFSKIGKYISNKLHHIHKTARKHKFSKPETAASHSSRHMEKTVIISKDNKQNKDYSRPKETGPTVGSYRLNYSAIDKNVHQYNFSRSTPHFYGVKYRAQQTTKLVKEYPDGLDTKQKGFMELARMAGRDQIKGSIRKNLEDPHQRRFEVHQFPTLTSRTGFITFEKMSPRKGIIDKIGLTLPEYDYNYQIKMKRLDSHILQFEKQTDRTDNFFNQIAPSQDYRSVKQQNPTLLDKTVAWSKQLPRQADGILPTYMDKTVTSRMAISLANFKTMEMNCSYIKKESKKLPKRRLGYGKENSEKYSEN